jgi:NTE family protein
MAVIELAEYCIPFHSQAVAASSAFPPLLSPVELDLEAEQWESQNGTDLHRKPYITKIMLSDGGVYDNMGIELR